jgi:hypothetical protein
MSSQEERIAARGKMFELVELPQPDGRVFEVARRAPGVRVIIADKVARTVLLTREHRRELDDWDCRLPGGKVFDSLDEYEAHRKSDTEIMDVAKAKAEQEAAEEAGIQIDEATFYKKSSLGATVEWDLYIFEATRWQPHPDGQNLQEDEKRGIDVQMYPYAQAEQMILDGKMQEERVALALFRWLRAQATN